MKKISILFISLITLSLGANAQLRVISNGHVQVGNWGTSSSLTTTSSDTTSTISLLGNGQKHSGAIISFGGRKDVTISETAPTLQSPNSLIYTSMMLLKGTGGIKYSSCDGEVFSYSSKKSNLINPGTGTTVSSDNPFTFNVNLKAPKYLTTSDARCKRNIEPIESLGKGLYELTPVSYVLSSPNESEGLSASKASKASQASSPVNYGFLAQEVREVYPDLVYEDSIGMLSLDYDGFIPLLVDEIKTLNARLEKQEELIVSLTTGAKKTKGGAGIESLYGDDNIVLMQNRPNPFKATTEIKCHLPQEVSEAFICIYDLNGRQQMCLDLGERGDVSVTVSGSTLAPGMYIYSLIADGREADSKRMILTE